MMSIRFYLAMFISRASFYILKIFGKNASHFPGVVAQKICPDVLKYLEAPEIIVAVTGTNGKTTTTNMIVDFLAYKKVDFVSNTSGSNIEGGIISSLLRSTSFFGKNKKDLAVFEVDERASVHIFPYKKPDILLVTNLGSDSYKRNAHVEYIFSIIESSIPKTSHLLLNADDVISSNLCKNNRRSYFSIAPQIFEEQITDSIIQDAPYCPICNGVLTYKFKRYHHIGNANCETCGYKLPKIDYEITEINDTEFKIVENNTIYSYKNKTGNITDNYNKLAAISTLRQLGYQHSEIKASFDEDVFKVTETRYDISLINGKNIISILAKGQNPVANSRVFDFIRKQPDWGSITLVFMNEESNHSYHINEVENTSWQYETDFEYLDHPNIKKIYCMGNRNLEVKTRLVLAGIDESIISLLDPSPILDIEFTTDSVILLHDTTNLDQVKVFRKTLEAEAAK